jgi:hypothetical protein
MQVFTCAIVLGGGEGWCWIIKWGCPAVKPYQRQCNGVNVARRFTHPVDAAPDLPFLCCTQGGLKA